MKLTVVLTVLVGALVLACSTVTPVPAEPTPNIDATVEAKVAQERAVDATVEARLKEERASQPQPTNIQASSPNDSPKPISTNAPTLVPTATSVPTPTPTPRPIPTPTPAPTHTPIGTTTVIGEKDSPSPILRINGKLLPTLESCSRVDGGEFCVRPVSNNSGSFPKGSTIYIAAFPDIRDSIITWRGVDENHGEIVAVEMTRNRFVTLDIQDRPVDEGLSGQLKLLGEPYSDPNGVEVVLTGLKTDSNPSQTIIDIAYSLRNQTTGIQPIFPWTVYLMGGASVPKYLWPNCFIHPGQKLNHTWRFVIDGGKIPIRLGYPGRLDGRTWERNDLLWEIQTGDQGSQAVFVQPQSVTYDEPLQITLFGLRNGIKLTPGSVSCDGVNLPLPGYYGVPGEIPEADDYGKVTFSTRLSATNTDIGLVSLDVESRPFFSARYFITFEGAILDTLPIGGRFNFNRPVMVAGSKYSPKDSDSSRPYIINGTDGSGIRIDGKLIEEKYVDYPIVLSGAGNFLTEITLPGINASRSASDYRIEIEDTGGRFGYTDISVDSPSVAIYGDMRCPGSELEIRGNGTWASNEHLGIENSVELEFVSISTSSGSEIPLPSDIGRVGIDNLGEFAAKSIVPNRVKPGSSVEIWGRPDFGESFKHRFYVPGPNINVWPPAGLVGESVDVMLTGLRPNYKLPPGSLTMGGVVLALPGYFGTPGKEPITDHCGSTTISTTVPLLSSGLTPIVAALPGSTNLYSLFDVRDASAKVTPSEVVLGQTVGFVTRELSPSIPSKAPRIISGLHESKAFIGTTFQNLPTPVMSDSHSRSASNANNIPQRHILRINGVSFPKGEACMPIHINLQTYQESTANEICVFPLPEQSGKFPKGTEVTLGLIENFGGYSYHWTGIDDSAGPVVSTVIRDDTDISVKMLVSDDNQTEGTILPNDASYDSEVTEPDVRVLGIPYEYIDGTQITLTAYSRTFNASVTNIAFSYRIENPTGSPQKSLRWKLYSDDGHWIIEKGLFCEILPGGSKELDIKFTFKTGSFNAESLVYPGDIFADSSGPSDLVWKLENLGNEGAGISEDDLGAGLDLEEPYVSSNGLEVTLRSLDVEPRRAGNVITISYRLWNKEDDAKQLQGWKIYYEDGGGIDQLGIFDSLSFGDIFFKTYKFFIPPGEKAVAVAYPGRLFEDVWREGDLVWFIKDFHDYTVSSEPIDNIKLDSRHIPYPIEIGRDGVTFFPIVIPHKNAITNNDFLAIYATDTAGRTAIGRFSVANPRISISTDIGPKGSLIKLTGDGFINGSGHFDRKYLVDIYYGVERSTNNRVSRRDLDSMIPVKTVVPNAEGEFTTSFRVPPDALPGSMNSIVAKVQDFDIEARAIHQIPDSSLNLSPSHVSVGEEITISGTGFPNSVPIITILAGSTRLEFGAIKTDAFGNFTVRLKLPTNQPVDNQNLIVSTRTFSKTMVINADRK